MRKNEPLAVQRLIGPIPYRDLDGNLKSGMTFTGSAGGVQLGHPSSPGSLANATNNAFELGTTGLYFVQLTQAETNVDTNVTVVLHDTGATYKDMPYDVPIDNTPDVNVASWDGTAVVGQGPGGALKPNTIVDKYVYDANKNPTAWRTRTFATMAACDLATPGNADGADGEVEREAYTATYNGDGTLASLKRDKQL